MENKNKLHRFLVENNPKTYLLLMGDVKDRINMQISGFKVVLENIDNLWVATHGPNYIIGYGKTVDEAIESFGHAIATELKKEYILIKFWNNLFFGSCRWLSKEETMEAKLKKFEEKLKNITIEEINKYFPTDNRPKGWLSIEEYLPKMLAQDIAKGYTVFKVKDKDGNEYESAVSDHNVWYHMAKEAGITHWLNE